MKSLWVENKIDYDGSQLRRMYAYENFGLLGDSIISFVGACDVRAENMKDGEDLFQGEKIFSESMLHFLIECHDTSLESMIAYQRLFTCMAKEQIEVLAGQLFQRIGDDLYLADKKLNISIASANALSSMIHCGFNVSSKNTPVKTVGLEDLGIEAKSFALSMMQAWTEEYDGIQAAKAKVFPL
mgnify:CR=1 FL=1|tara:strand:- start:5800 stop:6351 length:552 start_codon:yes stop_codon:yes gene_type:complete